MIQRFKIHGGIERKMIKLKIGMKLDSAEWEKEKLNTNKKNAKKIIQKILNILRINYFSQVGWG